MDMSRDNDRWVLELSQNGMPREAALADLRDALYRNLRKALSSRTVDEAFIEDTVQIALMRVLDKLAQFEGRSKFVTWATSIAIHIAFAELRTARWKNVSLNALVEQADFVTDRAVDASLSPDALAQQRSILDEMHYVIENQLTLRQKNALLAELKGMPQEEIARQLGSNRNAVYKLTHDARKKLRSALETAGHTADDVAMAFTN